MADPLVAPPLFPPLSPLSFHPGADLLATNYLTPQTIDIILCRFFRAVTLAASRMSFPPFLHILLL